MIFDDDGRSAEIGRVAHRRLYGATDARMIRMRRGDITPACRSSAEMMSRARLFRDRTWSRTGSTPRQPASELPAGEHQVFSPTR